MGTDSDINTTLFLRKGEERRLLAGHLWVYSNEVDTARSPLKGLEPGQAVAVLSQRGQWLAHAYVNPHSLISARVTSRRREQALDGAELRRRLRSATALRERLYAANCYRWVYGESDGLPGLVVDRYAGIAVVQINTAGMERWRDQVVDALVEIGRLDGVLLRCDGEQRALEGLPVYTEIAHGDVPDEVSIEENGIHYIVPLQAGQKTGWFFDQADNRLRARKLLNQGRVIDAFCYAGGWGISAALAGAAHVVCIDSSERALDYARRNAELNGVADKMNFIHADVAEALRDMGGKETADTIIIDPPAFVKRKRDQDAGSAAYQRLNEAALALLPEDGYLVSCSCSQHVDRDNFQRLIQKAARRSRRDLQVVMEGGQSADHPVHPAMPETRYLKSLMLRVR
ncbi:MAG: class I SAM-dependent rRNA methyltransferase [Gammaproteobacteria bacterium]|nr:class I SAM-dependent rRNA methyltransferase [Gammaproteobacteria bacterium]MDH4253274.1 class I SAM-dependent rRNA methyltransferase [Gammaproteobacteria bacterium]MDH5310251.1 class I SAM-dependent rRNA methyltransferase [Gammaproteobacteria bacterium]